MLFDVVAAVLFDLYETLVTELRAPPTRASALGPRLGVDATAFRRAWKVQRGRVMRGEVSFANALLAIGGQLGRDVDGDLVDDIVRERRYQKAAVLQHFDPNAFETLRNLRDCGCRLTIVSNCFAEDVEAWPHCPASECFDDAVFSFEVGAAKPELSIYFKALRRLRIDAREALFIGDGGDDELRGAERAGLRAAHATWFSADRVGVPPRFPRLPSWSAAFELAVRLSNRNP